MHIPTGLQGQGVHKWNLPSPYSVGWVFGSCILPSCFNNNTWHFQTLLLTQFDGYVVVYVFRSLYHEMYLMPVSVESPNPMKCFQEAYLKTTERMPKKNTIYFSPLSLVFLPSISSVPFLRFFFVHFPPFIHLAHCPVILVLFLITTAAASHR